MKAVWTTLLFCSISFWGGLVSHGRVTAQQARLFDRYSNVSWDDEQARLETFVIELQTERGAQGFIVVYAGRISRPNEAYYRGQRARTYITACVRTGDPCVEPSRVETRDGGYREARTTELWIVPLGANLPAATPTLRPDEVTILMPRSAKRTANANNANAARPRPTPRPRRRRRP